MPTPVQPSRGSTPRRRVALPFALALSALGLAAGDAAGQQQRLTPETVRAEGRLSDAQSAEVRSHVERGIGNLTSAGDVEAMAAARQELVGPLTAIGATPSFVQQYGRALAEGVGSLPADASPAERVNALLLLRAAPPQEAVPIVRPTLRNEQAAVRFTAAKVLLDLLLRPQGGAPPLDANGRRQLQTDLAAAAAAETDAYVVGKLLPALQEAFGDEGRARLIEMLNERVTLHAENPATGYLPELSEMSALFLRNLGNFQKAEAQNLCRAAAGYLKVASTQLAAGSTPAGEVADARRMLTQSDTILRELSVSQLNLQRNAIPDSIAGSLESGDFADISTTADAWAAAMGVPVVNVPSAPATADAAPEAAVAPPAPDVDADAGG